MGSRPRAPTLFRAGRGHSASPLGWRATQRFREDKRGPRVSGWTRSDRVPWHRPRVAPITFVSAGWVESPNRTAPKTYEPHGTAIVRPTGVQYGHERTALDRSGCEYGVRAGA